MKILFIRNKKKPVKSEIEATDQEKELADLQDFISANPNLHTRIMLQGKRGVHYLMPEDLADLESCVADQPEIRCKWN